MPEIDWHRFLELRYWFEGVAGESAVVPVIERGTFFFWLFLYGFAFVFTVGVILLLFNSFFEKSHPIRKFYGWLGNNLVAIGVVGVIWFLLRQIQVGLFGARFWVIVLLLWGLGIVGYLVWYYFNFYKLEYYFYKHKIDDRSSKG